MNENVYIQESSGWVRSCRARHVYYTTSPECETEIESGGDAYLYL